MNNMNIKQQAEDYSRIEQAIKFIESNFKSQPTLDEIAGNANLSRYHFDRLFKRWAGISPIQFMRFLTLEYAKKQLSDSQNLLDTSLDSGLSGPGRLHDLFVTFEAMSPGEYKRKGSGLKIEYGFHPTPFGECVLAMTQRGICHLGFLNIDRHSALKHLQNNWPNADFVEDKIKTGLIVKRIFEAKNKTESKPFHLLIRGTNFQINVWQALLTIPEGRIVSYSDIAKLAGNPNSIRPAATAVANNPVAYLIPCHRVIAKTGNINKYRWGSYRKKAMLGWEMARTNQIA